MSTEDLSTISLNNSTILNLTQTKFAEFVTSGGIDDGWDEYVAQLEASGWSRTSSSTRSTTTSTRAEPLVRRRA